MTREPVLTAGAIAGVVMAFLGMAVSLGWLRLDESQMQAIQAFVLPALGLILPIAAALYARRKVTPTADPKIDGQPAAIVPLAQLQAMQMAAAAPYDVTLVDPKGVSYRTYTQASEEG